MSNRRATLLGMSATTIAPAAAPWLANLSPECVAAVHTAVAEAPPLTDRQKRRLRMLFRPALSSPPNRPQS